MTRVHLVVVPIVLGIGVLATSCASSGSASACGSYRNDKAVKVGSHTIDAEVVDSERDLEKGLSGRKCIGADQGMLFVFEQPGIYQFGMKGMKFPIDIVWLDRNHGVVWLEKNVSPSTYPTTFLNRNGPAQYVLELKAGQAAKLGLKDGSVLTF